MNHDSPHKWQVVGELVVSFTAAGLISDEVWAGFVADLKDRHVTGLLCSTVGDIEVTSVQRKLAADAARSRGIPVVVIVDSRIVKGMVTAVSWLGVDIKAFGWDEVAQAVKSLKVLAATERRAIETIQRFRLEAA